MHTYIHTYIYMNTYTYVHMHIYIHAHIHIITTYKVDVPIVKQRILKYTYIHIIFLLVMYIMHKCTFNLPNCHIYGVHIYT